MCVEIKQNGICDLLLVLFNMWSDSDDEVVPILHTIKILFCKKQQVSYRQRNMFFCFALVFMFRFIWCVLRHKKVGNYRQRRWFETVLLHSVCVARIQWHVFSTTTTETLQNKNVCFVSFSLVCVVS